MWATASAAKSESEAACGSRVKRRGNEQQRATKGTRGMRGVRRVARPTSRWDGEAHERVAAPGLSAASGAPRLAARAALADVGACPSHVHRRQLQRSGAHTAHARPCRRYRKPGCSSDLRERRRWRQAPSSCAARRGHGRGNPHSEAPDARNTNWPPPTSTAISTFRRGAKHTTAHDFRASLRLGCCCASSSSPSHLHHLILLLRLPTPRHLRPPLFVPVRVPVALVARCATLSGRLCACSVATRAARLRRCASSLPPQQGAWCAAMHRS